MINWLNKIPEDWKVEEFRNIAELKHGYQFRNYDFTEEGIKIFKITQIKGDGIADISSCSYIDINRIDEFERVILNKGDILIALTGATIGKVARFNYDELVLQNYRVGNFFPLDEAILLKEYFYQYLKSDFFFNQILANQTQSAQQNIGKEDINNMSVILPPIYEQTVIASILSTIDAKIENNLAINKTLEEMAMALYKEWFVDFGPFQEGNFVESELGMIPEGWEVKRLDEISEVKIGRTPPRKEPKWFSKSDGMKWISIKDIGNSGLYIGETSEYLTLEAVVKKRVPIIQEDTVILSFKLTVGRVAITMEDMLSNEAIAHFNLNSSIGTESLYLYLKQFNYNTLGSTSSIATAVNSKTIKSIKILVPIEREVEEFNNIAKSIFNSIRNVLKQNQTLTTPPATRCCQG